MQPVELSQLAEKHKFLARSNISLDHKAFTVTSSTAPVCSKDVFLRSRIKSDLLKVPAPPPSLSRKGVKKVCSPDPLQAAIFGCAWSRRGLATSKGKYEKQ